MRTRLVDKYAVRPSTNRQQSRKHGLCPSRWLGLESDMEAKCRVVGVEKAASGCGHIDVVMRGWGGHIGLRPQEAPAAEDAKTAPGGKPTPVAFPPSPSSSS